MLQADRGRSRSPSPPVKMGQQETFRPNAFGVRARLDENSWEPKSMSALPKGLVEFVYFEVWNRADEDVARIILNPDFRFRVSHLVPSLPDQRAFGI
jgi:hypothetical protein